MVWYWDCEYGELSQQLLKFSVSCTETFHVDENISACMICTYEWEHGGLYIGSELFDHFLFSTRNLLVA